MAHPARVYRLDYHFPNDARSDCYKFGDFCGQSDCGYTRWDCGDAWIGLSIDYFGNHFGLCLHEIPEFGFIAVCAKSSSSSGGSYDCDGWDVYSSDELLGRPSGGGTNHQHRCDCHFCYMFNFII